MRFANLCIGVLFTFYAESQLFFEIWVICEVKEVSLLCFKANCGG